MIRATTLEGRVVFVRPNAITAIAEGSDDTGVIHIVGHAFHVKESAEWIIRQLLSWVDREHGLDGGA